jgi:hypothetical protein
MIPQNPTPDTQSMQNPNSELEKYAIRFRWDNALVNRQRDIDDRLRMLRDLYAETLRRQESYIKEANALKEELEEHNKDLTTTKGASEIIGTMIFEASEMFQFKKENNLNDDHIGFVITEILRDYKSLKLEEIAYLLRGGVAGKYGAVEYRLDAQIVINWVKAYVNEKNTRLARH